MHLLAPNVTHDRRTAERTFMQRHVAQSRWNVQTARARGVESTDSRQVHERSPVAQMQNGSTMGRKCEGADLSDASITCGAKTGTMVVTLQALPVMPTIASAAALNATTCSASTAGQLGLDGKFGATARVQGMYLAHLRRLIARCRGPSGLLDQQHSLRRQRQLASQIQTAAASLEERGWPTQLLPRAHRKAAGVERQRITWLVLVAVGNKVVLPALAQAVVLHATQIPALVRLNGNQS